MKLGKHHLPYNSAILFLIIMIGAVLRFFKFGEIQLTHDEFSTFFISNYDNLKDLWYKGIIQGDTHPPFIHTSYHYIKLLFGDAYWIIKLPFALMGLGSIYMTYLMGKKWFSETSGLMAASCMSIMQIMVMYSQIARMYISGTFFTLCLIWFWYLFIFEEKEKLKHGIGFTLFGILMIYNHHFTALLAAIISISGLFSIQKKDFKWYALSGIIIGCSYIPNIPIVMYQLSQKGLGWLGKPGPYFLTNFMQFTVHYSFVFALVVLLIVFFSFLPVMRLSKAKSTAHKMRIYMLVWFILFFGISFSYSQWISPILQFSIMIFVTPLMLLLAFGSLGERKVLFNVVSSIAILSIGSYSLVVGRQHYYAFYQSQFLRPMQEMQTLYHQHPNNTLILHSSVNSIMDQMYLDNEFNYDFHYIERNTPIAQIDSILAHSNADYFIWAWSKFQRAEVDQLAAEYYPHLIKKVGLFNGETYIRCKKRDNETASMSLNFNPGKKIDPAYRYNKSYLTIKDGEKTFHIDSSMLYPLNVSIPISKEQWDRTENMEISISYKSVSPIKDLIVTFTPQEEGKNAFWKGYHIKKDLKRGTAAYVDYFKYRFADYPRHSIPERLNIGIWNPGKNTIDIKDFKVEFTEGNPYIYSHFQNIKE